jgi:hypothetical protein
MNKLEKLISKIATKSILLEMAFQRKEVISEILSLSHKINEHLLYLILYPNHLAINHWKMEITGWLNGIGKMSLKPNNKRLDYETYFDSFTRYFDNNAKSYIINTSQDALSDEGEFEEYTINNLPLNDILKRYLSFYKTISKYFSENKSINKEEVKNMINNF